MAGDTVVGDASFVVYDGSETATVATDFSRPIVTVDGLGNPVAPNQQRYGDDATYAPPIQWTETGVALPQATYAKILASGWDSDDVTPLLIYHDQSHYKLTFYRGEDLSIASTLSLNNNDLMNGAVAGERFAPKAAIIHHGLVVFATARSVLTDGVYQIVGVDFLATQDYGATFERVPVVGGGYGLPILEEARGLDRLNTWCFESPFPVNELSDQNGVWFPWTDYIYKPGLPKGGQVGLFRADRAPGETHWTISPNRVVFSQWMPQDTGGLHAHTAAVTLGGVISHWGDVSYRNHTLFHQFDLNNYQTAEVTTGYAYGGYSPTVGSEQGAPQPVAAAPSPIPGAHLAGGDETPDHILSFGPMTATGDRLNVTSKVYRPEGIAPGAVYGGAAVLHLQWLQNVGYAAAAVDDGYYYYSPDGEHWARINLPTTAPSHTWLYGDRLLCMTNGRFWMATLPQVEVMRPLSISPGGVNLEAATLDVRATPGLGNSVRRVVYQENAWRYADTLALLSTQAPAPPFLSSAPVYEVTMGGEDALVGAWWLQPPGAISAAALPHVTDAWVANLSSQELRLGSHHAVGNVPAGQYAAAATRYYQINDNTQWTATGLSLDTSRPVDGRYSFLLRTLYKNPGAKFLVATPYFGESSAPTYPLAPQSSGPDEVETALIGPLSNVWTTGFVARWPESAPMQARGTTPIASLVGPTGDAVVWTVYQQETGTQLAIEAYRTGVLVTKQVYNTKLLRGEIFETLVSSDGGKLNITFRVDGQLPVTFEAPGAAGLQLERFQWAGRDGDVVMGIDPMLLVVDKDMAWTAVEHTQWIGSSLEQKAVFNSQPAPGDFNFDGAVDEADFDVWETTREAAVPWRSGDANGNGYVDHGDAEIWRQQYGMTGVAIEADFNADGVVDAADYTVWRDAILTATVAPGSGADANHDGFIRSDDLTFWFDNLGKSYSSLQQLRASSNPQPAAISAPSVTQVAAPVTAPSLSVPPAASEKATHAIQDDSAQRIAMLTYDAAFAATASQITTASKLRGARQVWGPGRHASLDAAFAAR
jgi:hypothetical protein